MPHAAVTLSDLGCLRPAPPDDEWTERVAHENLAVIWRNFAAAGAEGLLLERVLETRSLLGRVRTAFRGAENTVVRLHAQLDVLRRRILGREACDPAWFLGAAEYLDGVFETARVEDFAVKNVDCPMREVAAEVLSRAGWLD